MLRLANGDKLVIIGDSITEGQGQGTWYGPWLTGLQASGPPLVSIPAGGAMTSGVASVTSVARNVNSLTVVNAGVAGNRLDQLLARLATDCIAQNPTAVIVECAVNDIAQFTPPATYRGTHDTVLGNLIAAGISAAKIASVGVFCYNEIYPDTGVGSFGAAIDAQEAQTSASCAAVGVTYVDVRTPQQLYESLHNTPPPGAQTGILCLDGAGARGVHPNAALGIPMWSLAMGLRTFTH